jgi:hypothetical protein
LIVSCPSEQIGRCFQSGHLKDKHNIIRKKAKPQLSSGLGLYFGSIFDSGLPYLVAPILIYKGGHYTSLAGKGKRQRSPEREFARLEANSPRKLNITCLPDQTSRAVILSIIKVANQ